MNRKIYKIIILVLAVLSLNNVILLIRNYSYAYFEKNIKTGVKLKITTLDKIPSKLPETAQKVLDKANEKQLCNPINKDEDGIIYFSADDECVDFNYVWYSGKLWRIVAINTDGSLKLVTENIMTTIKWGRNSTFKDSWVYQWLNEDFLSTLYNYENIIVQNASWNVTLDNNKYTPVKPSTLSNQTTVEANVGLLNAYEYKVASGSYLFKGYSQWLITPMSNSSTWANFPYVFAVWSESYYKTSSNAYGVRPSIYLNPEVVITSGNGSKDSPYQLSGDKESGKVGEKINTRLSGEYVKVDNKVYRIVGIDKDNNGNNITKLTSVDYIRNGDEVLTKHFSSSSNDLLYGKGTTTNTSNLAGYLNNTWLSSELRKYITNGTYYLDGENESYKNTICNTWNTTEPISNCEKTSNTWTGLVGLPRVGEMFASQLGYTFSSSSSIWTVTPSATNQIIVIDKFGKIDKVSPDTYDYGAIRPSIFLKSEVKITSGDGMSPETAYTIGL